MPCFGRQAVAEVKRSGTAAAHGLKAHAATAHWSRKPMGIYSGTCSAARLDHKINPALPSRLQPLRQLGGLCRALDGHTSPDAKVGNVLCRATGGTREGP